ncbi:MAG: AbgT family transporter [Bacilli bacterium]
MKEHKKLKLKKFNLHPITTFILLTIFVMIISSVLSFFQVQATYSTINPKNGALETVFVAVEGLFNYDGLKYVISNASRNFISFAPLATILITIIGLSVAQSTGFIETLIKRNFLKIDNQKITFFLILLATMSSLINDIGYVILIPLGAAIFLANGRNPLAGITTAFCGVAFGYGATIFVGSSEVGLIPYTTVAARLIDEGFHVSLTSNLFIMIAFTIILSIVGTLIIEKIIIPKIGKYRTKSDLENTKEIEIETETEQLEDVEQEKLALRKKESDGLRNAYIWGGIFILIFIYTIIPNLPFSGMLLDMNEKTYLNQLFGINSYFQDGFTYMIAILLLVVGIAYGLGAKTIKNDRELVEKASIHTKEIGGLVILIFFASQFISVFKQTNIGTVIAAWGVDLISNLSFSGLPLLILVIIVIALTSFFLPNPISKWAIFSPVVVPILMQSNISPQFAQFILRGADSMVKGATPLLSFFVIYLGYLNIYNTDKEHPIGIKKAISYLSPYLLIISLTWILLLVGWYLIGLPIGPSVYPVL